MTELAVAYVSVVAETSKIAPAVGKALGQAQGQADRVGADMGKSMGGKLTGALGSAMKVGGASAVAAGSLAIGSALHKGFERLSAIDDAKGKLAGLGTSTQNTAKIMDSALASVKGTAYGLGDAATIAASAVAAGVKPGKDLTEYLKMTADAASIAGVSLGDMGLIINQVHTGQTAMTDDLNQLADRGLPIYQWIADQMKVPASEVKDLASKGKISAQIFEDAIKTHIGGAALKAGTTVRGAFDNMKAAMGRVGAAALGPTFGGLPGVLNSVTGALDRATPKVEQLAKAFDHKLRTDWLPEARDKVRQLRTEFDKLKSSDLAQSSMARLETVFASVKGTALDLAPALKQIISSLAQASGALGVSSWQLFIAGLETGASALQAIAPLIQGVAGFMHDNQAAVTGAAIAFALFKTVPAVLTRIQTSMASATGSAAGYGAALRSAAVQASAVATNNGVLMTSTGRVTTTASQAAMQMGRFGSSIQQLGSRVPAVQRMQQAFITTAVSANNFARTQGAAAASMSGLRSAGAGLAGVFGGPLGLALTGAAIAYGVISSKNAQARSQQEAYASAVSDTSKAQTALTSALMGSRGAMDAQVLDRLTGSVAALESELDAAGKNTSKGFWHGDFFPGQNSTNDKMKRTADAAKDAKKAIDDLGMTDAEVAGKISGSQGAWDDFAAKLRASGDGGKDAANKLQTLRDKFVQTQQIAQMLPPGFTQMSAAVDKFRDSTASAADKASALKAAIAALNPQQDAAGAEAAFTQQIDNITSSLDGAVDSAGGFGDALIKANGSINTATTNGAALTRQINDTVGAYADVVARGGDVAQANSQIDQAVQSLSNTYGVSADVVRNWFNQAGLGTAGMVADLAKVKDDAQASLGVVAQQIANVNGKPITIKSDAITPATKGLLNSIGYQLHEFDGPGGQKMLTITSNAGVTANALNNVAVSVTKLPDGNIKINDNSPEALQRLEDIGFKTKTLPDGTVVIDTDDAQFAATMAKIQSANYAATVRVQMQLQMTQSERNIIASNITPQMQQLIDQGAAYAATNANGSIRKYANGGTTLPDQAVIQRAQPGGGLVQWAEPETGGEAFIPLAQSKRSRSRKILASVADMFGLSIGEKFAEGGIRSASAISRFPRDEGLEGADYVFGGIHWGDCTAAMAAIARFAVGLDPWGGRFATGNMAAALQAMGFQLGRGSSGDLRYGWIDAPGTPGGGHAAGTLPDDTAVEMGGVRGNGQVGGGAANADDPQFTEHAFLKVPGKASNSGDSDAMVTPDKYSESDYTDTPPEKSTATKISDRFGDAAKAAVGDQISDILGVFGIPDDPSVLSAATKYNEETDGYKRQLEGAKKRREDLVNQNRQREADAQNELSGNKKQSGTDPALDKLPVGNDGYAKVTAEVAKRMGLGKDAAIVSMMAELVESGPQIKMFANSNVPESLRLPHDAVGSNGTSLGPHQQQNKWGSVADRMNAAKSNELFYNALKGVPNWEQMAKGDAAQAVQRSAFGGRYAGQEPTAYELISNIGVFDQGGFLLPGLNLIANKTGKPEPVPDPRRPWSYDDGANASAGPDYSVNIGTIIARDAQDLEDGLLRRQRVAVMRNRAQVTH